MILLMIPCREIKPQPPWSYKPKRTYEISLNAAYSFKSLANSQTTMPAVTLTLSECFVPN